MKISNSKSNTFRRCPKKFEFAYVHRLEPKRKRVQLEKGTWIHSLLEAWYSGRDWQRVHRKLTNGFNKLFVEEREELGDLPDECKRIMQAYLERYAEEDEGEETIATELDEWVKLPNGDDFNFIIDRVLVRPDGGVWLKDYKTSSGFMDAGFMLIDAQLARYLWGFRRIPKYRKLARRLRGVEFDELRTKAPTIPDLVYVGTSREGLTQRADIDTDVATYMRAIKQHGLDPKDYRAILTRLGAQDDRFFRRTVIPRDRPLVRSSMIDLMDTATDIKRAERRGRFPRTPDKSCTWGCDFLEPCTIELQGGNIGPVVDLKYNIKEKGARERKGRNKASKARAQR